MKYSHPEALTLHPPGNVRSNLFTTPQPILVICFPAITSSWSLFNGQQLYQTSNALVAAPYRKMSDKLTTQKEGEKRPVKSVISHSRSCTFFPADFLSRSIKCNLCRQKASGYKERLHPVGKSVSATARRNDLFPLNASHARLSSLIGPGNLNWTSLRSRRLFPKGERGGKE